VIDMIRHPDRSAAEWRDLLFVWVSTHATRCDSVSNFRDRTPGRNHHFLPQITQPETSVSHAIWSKVSPTCLGPFQLQQALGPSTPPTSATPFRTGNTGSNRRTSLDSDLAARTLSSRFRPKVGRGFQPSFLRPLRTINSNRGAENAESMCLKTNEDGDARHDCLRFSLRKLHRMGRPVQ
jgi:hypothetical protein